MRSATAVQDQEGGEQLVDALVGATRRTIAEHGVPVNEIGFDWLWAEPTAAPVVMSYGDSV